MQSGESPALDAETRQRIDAILALFDGQETAITAAGRENTRAVNRITRLVPLRRVGGETTFRRNIARYHVEGAEHELIIGAERAGGGVWRLISRWSDD